jgi:hypothetical protein
MPVTISNLNFKTQSYEHLINLYFNFCYIFLQPSTYFVLIVYQHVVASDSYNTILNALLSTHNI